MEHRDGRFCSMQHRSRRIVQCIYIRDRGRDVRSKGQSMVKRLMSSMQRVLVLAPHTDDAELGCGGTIARLLREGEDVFVAAFSTAEGSLPPGTAPTRLRDEFLTAMQSLGIPPEKTSVF